MRLRICLLAACAAVAGAQQPTAANYNREQIVTRLNADLANLKTLPATGGLSFGQCRMPGQPSVQRAEECGPADRVAEDFSLLHPSRSRHFPAEMLSLNLVNILSGRDLEPDALWLFSSSLVDAVAIADRAVERRTRVSGFRAFRDSVMRAYTGLLALGINRNRAETFLGNFVRNAESLSKPPDFEPIPPARPF